MKRIVFVFILLFILVIFFGCSFLKADTPKLNDVIRYAENNQDKLVTASIFLLDKVADKAGAINLTRVENDLYRKYSYHNETAEEVSLPILSPLFDSEMIDIITLRANAVEFAVGGSGIASNTTYYKLIYIPSDKVEDLFGFSDDFKMHYDDKKGGFYGEIEGCDDTYFYYKISNHLYYIIVHY